MNARRAWLALPFVLFACERERRSSTEMDVPRTEAVERIVSARCDRLERCTNLGLTAGPAPAECRASLRASLAGSLDSCAREVVREELDECVDSIRAERCGSPAASLARLAECEPNELCRARR